MQEIIKLYTEAKEMNKQFCSIVVDKIMSFPDFSFNDEELENIEILTSWKRWGVIETGQLWSIRKEGKECYYRIRTKNCPLSDEALLTSDSFGMNMQSYMGILKFLNFTLYTKQIKEKHYVANKAVQRYGELQKERRKINEELLDLINQAPNFYFECQDWEGTIDIRFSYTSSSVVHRKITGLKKEDGPVMLVLDHDIGNQVEMTSTVFNDLSTDTLIDIIKFLKLKGVL